MKKAEEWFNQYGISHKNKTNIFIHKICVPAIMFSVICLFYSIPFPEKMSFYPWLNWGTILIISSWFFYMTLGKRVLFLMMTQSILMYWGVLYLEPFTNLFYLGLITFVVAWIFQFIGHKIEGLKPSFLEDLQFLLIGPAWVFRKLIGYQ